MSSLDSTYSHINNTRNLENREHDFENGGHIAGTWQDAREPSEEDVEL